MRKHGVNHFFIETLEEVPESEDLGKREMFWIEQYDSYYHGYNETLGGEGNTLYRKEEIFKLWDSGLSTPEISKTIGSCVSAVYCALLDYPGYSVEESYARRAKKLQKKVCQFDLNGNYLKTFNSVKEAADFIEASDTSIGSCCNRLPGHKTVKNYLWTWEKDKDKISDFVKELKNSRRSVKQMQRVVQLDENNNILAVYDSAKIAAQAFGRPKDSHIGDCCKGRRKTCFGYKWKFEDDL